MSGVGEGGAHWGAMWPLSWAWKDEGGIYQSRDWWVWGLDSMLCVVMRVGSVLAPVPVLLYTICVTSFPFLTSQPHLQIMLSAHRLIRELNVVCPLREVEQLLDGVLTDDVERMCLEHGERKCTCLERLEMEPGGPGPYSQDSVSWAQALGPGPVVSGGRALSHLWLRPGMRPGLWLALRACACRTQ